jgi:NADH-quinone oxidoreductase subunit L
MLAFFFNNLLIATVSKKYLTYKGVQVLMIINNLILFIFCLYFWTFFILNVGQESVSFKLNSNNWMNINYEILFKINSLNFLFILLVSVIGLATNFYILNYFKYEERGEEFILLINWFIFSMIFLVIGNNFFTLIVGWELIGLTSFLLINFWRFKITTLGCSFKAFTFNKVSDIFLMIGFCLLWNTYKTSNIDTLLTLITLNPINCNDVLFKSGLCILISSSIKSAQLIGHLWLPDSMEAPVPASSLIHSATLVSAGIYLLLKFQIIFNYSGLTSYIFFLGSFTACYGGIIAASQSDMKKLLAYSTISHCGFIVASISLNNFLVTVVYLYLHGLFKALTFFCAGSIIKFNGTQDTRLMGMNKNQLVNIITLSVASINLGGLPFTFGYLYKFLFLNYLIINPINIVGYGLNIVGMLCSIVYVYKLIYYSCFDYRKGAYQLITLLIQNNKNWLKHLVFNFTIVKVIAFSIIYLFACCFFFIIKFFFLKNYIFFFFSGDVEVSDYYFISDLILVQSHLVSIYYILFTVTLFILVLMNWRENFFFIERLELLTTLFGLVVFYVICARSLMYIHLGLVKFFL